jgi:excisionase family DNA binding protein
VSITTSPHALAPTAIQAIVVSPAEASRLLGASLSHVYVLMRRGEIQSYLDGRARRITVASIHRYIERQIAIADADEWRTQQARRREREAKKRAPSTSKAVEQSEPHVE